MSDSNSNLHRRFDLILIGCVVVATVSYLVFLYGSWVQFQTDRLTRDSKIDELLDRFPKGTVPPVPAKKAEPVAGTDDGD